MGEMAYSTAASIEISTLKSTTVTDGDICSKLSIIRCTCTHTDTHRVVINVANSNTVSDVEIFMTSLFNCAASTAVTRAACNSVRR